jgi:hypothetical protein
MPTNVAVIARSRPKLPPRPEMATVTLTIPADKIAKLDAFMASDTWEKAQALREAGIDEGAKSLGHCLKFALEQDCSGARVFATFLASLYNGERVKADVSDLRRLDPANFEHLMNVLRLSFETNSEPHTFFQNGGDLFERLIRDWRLEKPRKGR